MAGNDFTLKFRPLYFVSFRLAVKERRLSNIKNAVEEKVGHKVDLERDEKGRWTILMLKF